MRIKQGRLMTWALGLFALAVGCLGWLLIKVLPGLSWWPGWPSIGDWFARWWPAGAAVAASVAAVVVLRQRKSVLAISADDSPARAVPRWVRGPDGKGWVPRSDVVPGSDSPSFDAANRRGWDWTKTSAAVTAFTALAALIFTSQSLAATRQQNEQTQESINQAEQGQITDRYTAAVDQIGTVDSNGESHIETRLGGLYALERLMTDSPRDQPTIVEVLSAFIRSSSPLATDGGPCPSGSPKLDVQAAITVLARRNSAQDHGSTVDLHSTCLNNADFSNTSSFGTGEGFKLLSAQFVEANLSGCDLEGAIFYNANLSGAQLTMTTATDARFEGVNLSYANLSGSELVQADLSYARLGRAIFGGANLANATFDQSYLAGANFNFASLNGANLSGSNVTDADFRLAKNVNFNGSIGTPRQ